MGGGGYDVVRKCIETNQSLPESPEPVISAELKTGRTLVNCLSHWKFLRSCLIQTCLCVTLKCTCVVFGYTM